MPNPGPTPITVAIFCICEECNEEENEFRGFCGVSDQQLLHEEFDYLQNQIKRSNGR